MRKKSPLTVRAALLTVQAIYNLNCSKTKSTGASSSMNLSAVVNLS